MNELGNHQQGFKTYSSSLRFSQSYYMSFKLNQSPVMNFVDLLGLYWDTLLWLLFVN